MNHSTPDRGGPALVIAVIIFILGSLFAGTAAFGDHIYSDVPDDSFAAEEIHKVTDECPVFSGYTDGTFRPWAPLLRVEGALMVERMVEERVCLGLTVGPQGPPGPAGADGDGLVQTYTFTRDIEVRGEFTESVFCERGYVATGGGYQFPNTQRGFIDINGDHPVVGDEFSGWTVSGLANANRDAFLATKGGNDTPKAEGTLYVVCAKAEI